MALILVSSGPMVTLEAALVTVVPVCRAYGVELIVARAGAPEERRPTGLGLGDVSFVPAPEDATIADLRREGLARTDADIVTFVEDAAVGVRDWAEIFPQRAGLIRTRGTSVAGS